MMKINRTILSGAALFFTASLSYADSWPIFFPPDLNLLIELHEIDTSTCPSGQGKLVERASINVQTYLCKNFCPRDWEWVTHSDGLCHDLYTGFRIQGTDIGHYTGNDGNTSYSQIIAYYGEKTTPHAARQSAQEADNKIIFTSTPNEHWYCIEIDDHSHRFTCASDI